MTDQKRAAIYARSAVVQEIGSNNAITEQIHQCKEFGEKQRYILSETNIFQEIGSGSSIDRQVLREVLRSAAKGNFDVLIIRSFDRLSRNPDLTSDVIETFEEYGVKVQSASENAQMERMILAIFEEFERIKKERISLRIRAGRQAKK